MKNILRSSLRTGKFVFMVGLFLVAVAPQLVQATPARQTVADNVVKALTTAFNAKDLNACLALMTDDAMVTVVNPSDLANATLTRDTLTYKGKLGSQPQLANFFNINFTNGFIIWSTNFKSTDTSFNGPMQLAIRDFVIDTDVQGTLEGGKIKTLVITDKNITKKAAQPVIVPIKAPMTGLEAASPAASQSPTYLGWVYVFAITGTMSLVGLILLRKWHPR